MATNGTDLLAGFSDGGPGAEVQILTADFSVRAKWRLPNRPDHLAMRADAIIATHLRDGGGFTACSGSLLISSAALPVLSQ